MSDQAAGRVAGVVGAAVGLLNLLAVSHGVPWPHCNDLSVRLLTQAGEGRPPMGEVPAMLSLPNTTGLAASVMLLLVAGVVGCWYWRRQQVERVILLLLEMTGLIAIIAHGWLEITQLKGSITAGEGLVPLNMNGLPYVSLRSVLYQVAPLLFAIVVMGFALAIIDGPSAKDKPTS